MYIPVEKMDRLEKYVSNDIEPQLFRLGTRGLNGKGRKLKRIFRNLRRNLLKYRQEGKARMVLYIRRILCGRRTLKRTFPFEETEDQKKCHK